MTRSHGRVRHDGQLKPEKKYKRTKPFRQATDIDTPLTELRKKIRSLEKLLAHDAKVAKALLDSKTSGGARSMPSHVRQEKERALAGYQHDLGLALAKKTRDQGHSKMITRYHRVRFFERKKAERVLKHARTALEKGEGSEEAVLNAQTDLNYALYLPLNEKYISLWPQDGEDDPNKVRDDTSWRMIRDVYVEARDSGLTEPEIGDKLLEIRDDGWKDTIGTKPMTSVSSRPSYRPIPASQQKVRQDQPNEMKTRTTDQIKLNTKQNGNDEDMEHDSDGFFET